MGVLAFILINFSAKPLLGLIELEDPQQIAQIVLDFMGNTTNLIKIIVSFVVFGMVTFFVGASLKAMDIYMYKDIINTGKASLKKAYKNKSKYFWKIVGVRASIFLIIFIFLLLVSFISSIIPFDTNRLAAVLFLVGGIYIFLSFFFVYPIIALQNKGILKTIKFSHKYFRMNIKHTLFVFLTILILFFSLELISFLISLTLNLITATYLTVYTISLIRLILSLWSNLIIFFCYKN